MENDDLLPGTGRHLMELENGARIEAASVIHDLNITMTWVNYPGRTNGTATAVEVDFATAGGVRQ